MTKEKDVKEQDDPESKEQLTIETADEEEEEEELEEVDVYGSVEGEILVNQRVVLKESMPTVEKRWLQLTK